jgi:hypothetical protein
MSKPKTLSDCVELVRKKEAFTFTSMFATLRNTVDGTVKPPTYTVYSYGLHYPMYVYDYEACQWYGNADKSTRTTERHKNLVKPYSVAQWVDTETIRHISLEGIVNTTANRMTVHELL